MNRSLDESSGKAGAGGMQLGPPEGSGLMRPGENQTGRGWGARAQIHPGVSECTGQPGETSPGSPQEQSDPSLRSAITPRRDPLSSTGERKDILHVFMFSHQQTQRRKQKPISAEINVYLPVLDEIQY